MKKYWFDLQFRFNKSTGPTIFSWVLFCLGVILATAAATIVVAIVATVTAAGEDEDKNHDPPAAVTTEEAVVVTHSWESSFLCSAQHTF